MTLLRPCWLLVERGSSARVTAHLISTGLRLCPWEEWKEKGGWNSEREWLSHHVIQHDLFHVPETRRSSHFGCLSQLVHTLWSEDLVHHPQSTEGSETNPVEGRHLLHSFHNSGGARPRTIISRRCHTLFFPVFSFPSPPSELTHVQALSPVGFSCFGS